MRNVLGLAFLALLQTNPLVRSLKIASYLNTIEYTPESIASEDFFNGTATIINGGVANISIVDLAGNAETQALRQFARSNDLRIIYTVCEAYYRIVGSKKQGINVPADLKGKRIGTLVGTSSQYFVTKFMQSIGLGDGDYTMVRGTTCERTPCGADTFPAMLQSGQIDAVGVWEPTIEIAARMLGDDAIIFQNTSVYREIYNLHTTAGKLQDPTIRRDIIDFIRALNNASKLFETDPDAVIPRVSKLVNIDQSILKAVWPVHKFRGTLAPDLIDVLEEEEKFIAKVDGRQAASRANLEALIDLSVLEEAMKS
jgi:ABC-type nitrate/sulfonate/bicarbonate transport system substrate-binding protein